MLRTWAKTWTSALVLLGWLAACDSALSAPEEPAAAQPAEGDAAAVSCPHVVPAPGDPCALPDGTTCDFGACGTRLAACVRGNWSYGGNPPPNPPCPELVPLAMSACPDCWPKGGTCTYHETDCFSGDAAAQQQIAVLSCDKDGGWFATYRPCPVPDAGADVQRDGDADAD
jgi:hypothetical protein